MPPFEDVSFEVKNYVRPQTMVVGVADRRTGADTLVILSGTVLLPHDAAAAGATDGKIRRKRIRFVLPQAPKVLTAASQVRGMQVVTAMASFHYQGEGDRTFAIDQSIIEWGTDVNEVRVTIDTACEGRGSVIIRVMYNAYVLAHVG
jgi:hypothetical protein